MLLSRNYPPSARLRPYIARHYVFTADLPPDFELIDRLLAETAFVRVLRRGDWTAETAPGQWASAGQVVLFGSNSRPLRVRCRGPFSLVGIAFRPCGWRVLFDEPASEIADRMLPFSDLWGDVANRLLAAVTGLDDDAAIVAASEAIVDARLAERGAHHVDPPMRVFERIARNDSTMRVSEVAMRLGLSGRQLERHCLASFGHSPKTILRRSRFLDMAAAMRGFGTPSDEELAGLRYFDQSHRNREFRRFIELTPGQFTKTPTPLLDAGLQLRTLRKAEQPDE